jgi:DNA-binding CsgD family transcriptional regulator/tetratricopeptide (TPR) repeat protein
MTITATDRLIHGREPEQAAIRRVLESARAGVGSSLVLLGEAGSGKSALLAQAVDLDAAGMTVVRTAGVESEAPLAFAALQRLLAPLMPLVDGVAAPQGRALRVAFGEDSGELGDRFLVFMGARSLLGVAAERSPVLVIVDDAQWLDEASAAALHFVARRVGVERVALLWAARPDDRREFDADELPVLQLCGLDMAGVSAILAEEMRAEVAPEVAALLLANTGGNPLAIRELPSALTAEQLAGLVPLPPRLPVTERIERLFLDRARRMSPEAQTLLLIAAADDSARLTPILQAATELGAGPDALAEVEQSGLVTVRDHQVSMRHPLVRSAVYSAASSVQRRQVHAALAAVLTGAMDADRRAWHRSAAVVEPDESVVAELVAAAERAERRGGYEAATAAWARASELTPDGGQRGRFLYAASMAAWISAHPDRALHLVDGAIVEADDPQLVAVARRLRARIEWNTGSVVLAHRMFLEAAQDVAPHDSVLARELATEAVSIAVWTGNVGTEMDATSIVSVPDEGASAREWTYHHLLLGLDRVVEGDPAAAAEQLRRAFEAYQGLPEDYDLLPGLSIGAMHLGDFQRAETYLHRLLSRARSDGGVVMVLYALTRLAMIDFVAGRWSDAATDATEAVSLGDLTSHPVLADTPAALLLLLAALRGDHESLDELAPRLDVAISRGAVGVLGVVLRDLVHWAHGTREAMRPPTAFHRFAQMSHDLTKRMAGLDRVEAAVRGDQAAAARLWVEELTAFAAGTGQAWAAAIAEHGRALLAHPDAAERHFLQALEMHARADTECSGRPFDRARTELAYGEFLRRSRRRVDARVHLRAAHDAFEGLRAKPWLERAATELRASGETVRKRSERSDAGTLTPQERQVAQLVRQGMSNKDVAAQLFLSPRTVDFHLRNVFAKTGISSRGELMGLALGE